MNSVKVPNLVFKVDFSNDLILILRGKTRFSVNMVLGKCFKTQLTSENFSTVSNSGHVRTGPKFRYIFYCSSLQSS